MSALNTVGLVLFDSIIASAARLIPSYRCTAPGAVRYVEKSPVLPTLPFSANIAFEKALYAGPLVSVTRLSARKFDESVFAPTAADTDLYQSGEIVAEVPIMGGSLPPFSCLTSERNVASGEPSASVRITSGWAATIFAASVRNVLALRSSVWLATSVWPAFLIAEIAGAMNVCEPMSLPN